MDKYREYFWVSIPRVGVKHFWVDLIGITWAFMWALHTSGLEAAYLWIGMEIEWNGVGCT